MSHAVVIIALDGPGELEELVHEQMQPFDENGEVFRAGSRWDWWVIGGRASGRLLGEDTCRRGDLTPERLAKFNARSAEALWSRFMADKGKNDPFIREYCYGLAATDTLESVKKRLGKAKLSAHAFLREQRWYENSRMGWFGAAATTECQAIGRDKGKCIVGKIDKPPCIVGFNESNDRWEEHYFNRFIEPLPAKTRLVIVDYHV